MAPPTRKMTVSVDYGTTHTSVAYGEKNGDQIFDVAFPSATNQLDQYHLSTIALFMKDRGWVFGHDVDRLIEDGLASPEECIEMVKMGLDKSDTTAQIREGQTKIFQKIGLQWDEGQTRLTECPDVITAYFKWLLPHATGNIQKATSLNTEVELEFCITVPANWSPSANHAMLTAFQKAIDSMDVIKNPDLGLITETEAAVALLQKEETLAGRALFVDGGGGTVNVGVWDINEGKLQEVTCSTGEINGSQWLNLHFRSFFHKYLAGRSVMQILLQNLQIDNNPEKLLDIGVKSFDIEKKIWTGEQLRIHIAGIKAIPGKDIIDNYVLLDGKIIKDLFDEKIVNRIMAMIESQIADLKQRSCQLPKIIILVGGLCYSPYVFKSVKDHFCDKGHKFDLKYPRRNPTTAISRGGVLRMWEKDKLTSVFARQSIGGCYHVQYDRHKHKHIKARFDEYDNQEWADDIFRPLFQKGDEILRISEKTIAGHRTLPLKGLVELEERIFSTSTRWKSDVQVDDDSNDITQEGSVMTCLTEHDRAGFPVISSGRQSYYVVNYELHVKLNYPKLEYTFKIPRTGIFSCTESDEDLLIKKGDFLQCTTSVGLYKSMSPARNITFLDSTNPEPNRDAKRKRTSAIALLHGKETVDLPSFENSKRVSKRPKRFAQN